MQGSTSFKFKINLSKTYTPKICLFYPSKPGYETGHQRIQKRIIKKVGDMEPNLKKNLKEAHQRC
jgi:hypothetical protein